VQTEAYSVGARPVAAWADVVVELAMLSEDDIGLSQSF